MMPKTGLTAACALALGSYGAGRDWFSIASRYDGRSNVGLLGSSGHNDKPNTLSQKKRRQRAKWSK